ncbi:formin-like protein 5 [Penaeus monodon]|uniref:formin-like protein 5 n=1 Tax=Penaeus monodon TaxID=6687 RepID=UPI0018A7A64D|nr:formin-like protein 5 [Penaeus monodon]
MDIVGPAGTAPPRITGRGSWDRPRAPPVNLPAPKIPPPEVRQHLFIPRPGKGASPEPIVIPPPRHRLVYVLKKQQGEAEGHRIPDGPPKPEVFSSTTKRGEKPPPFPRLRPPAAPGGQRLSGSGPEPESRLEIPSPFKREEL